MELRENVGGGRDYKVKHRSTIDANVQRLEWYYRLISKFSYQGASP